MYATSDHLDRAFSNSNNHRQFFSWHFWIAFNSSINLLTVFSSWMRWATGVSAFLGAKFGPFVIAKPSCFLNVLNSASNTFFRNFYNPLMLVWIVSKVVLSYICDFKIFNSVVQFIFIDVVNDFGSQKWPLKMVRHNESVFQNPPTLARIWMQRPKQLSVSVLVYCLMAIVPWIIFPKKAMALEPASRRIAFGQSPIGSLADHSKFVATSTAAQEVGPFVAHGSTNDTIWSLA